MKISTKGRYAVRLLLDIAENSDGGYVSLKDIAERQDLSKKYLEQIVPILTRADMLCTNRGQQGGYKLTNPPEKYTVGDILRLTENNLAPVSCLEHTPNRCERCASCTTLPIWQGLYDVVNEYLDSITLGDILEKKREHPANDYVI